MLMHTNPQSPHAPNKSECFTICAQKLWQKFMSTIFCTYWDYWLRLFKAVTGQISGCHALLYTAQISDMNAAYNYTIQW